MAGRRPWPRCRCQARKAHLTFTKDNNYLTHITNAARLAKIADTLAEERAKGRLTQVCEQWIYATRLCFALDSDQQERTGFHYSEATIASTSWLLRAVGARNGCVLVLEELPSGTDDGSVPADELDYARAGPRPIGQATPTNHNQEPAGRPVQRRTR